MILAGGIGAIILHLKIVYLCHLKPVCSVTDNMSCYSCNKIRIYDCVLVVIQVVVCRPRLCVHDVSHMYVCMYTHSRKRVHTSVYGVDAARPRVSRSPEVILY